MKCLVSSTFALFAAVATSSGASVILNEYNAGGATDVTGDWFEIVVVGGGIAGDTVDMRGWQFTIDELGAVPPDPQFGVGSFRLSDHDYWSDVQAGTIITFHEDNALNGGRDTALLAINNFTTEGWAHTNIWVRDLLLIDTDFAGHDPSYPISEDQTQITIRRRNGTVEFGPAGEGHVGYTGGGVNEMEVFKLEADPSPMITLGSDYRDGSSSTFGAPNEWGSQTTPERQDFSAFIIPEPASVLLAGAAGVGVLCLRRRRR